MMKVRNLILTAGLVIPGAAFAQMNVGDVLGSTEAEILSAVEAQGYVVNEIEIEDGDIEVEAVLDGKTYEIEVSSKSGMVLEIELDDEDDSEDS